MKRKKKSKRVKVASKAPKMESELCCPEDLRTIKRAAAIYNQRREEEQRKLCQHFKKESDKKKAFRQWCLQYTEQNFPHIGCRAYAVPPFYFKRLQIKQQESDQRGEQAERRVAQAFRVLNNRLEARKEETMFIIGNCLYEHVLINLLERDKNKLSQKFSECKEVFASSTKDPNRYFTIPKDASVSRGHPDLLVLHNNKGVLIVQVKSVGCCRVAASNFGSILRNELKESLTQLKNDYDVFLKVMEYGPRWDLKTVRLVLALPYVEKSEYQTQNVEKENELTFAQQALGQGITVPIYPLLKEDLFQEPDSMLNESELDIREFEDRWNSFQNCSISTEFIQDAIARYIGIFSLPREFKFETLRNHTQTLSQAIMYTGILFRKLFLTENQKTFLSEDSNRRIHLQGLPGSGRTTMLILKAERFLKSESTHHVVVVDMCRGSAGRLIGHQITSAIRNKTKEEAERVHHFPVREREQAQFEKNMLAFFNEKSIEKEKVLFVMDEIFPEEFFKGVWGSFFSGEFRTCQVWCADGLVKCDNLSPNPEAALRSEYQNRILRIPPVIRGVLHCAYWDADGQKAYKVDEKESEIPAHGPLPVCVRHEGHVSDKVKVTDCQQCGQELGELLTERMQLLEDEGKMDAASSSAEDASKLSCNIAILYGMPLDHYNRPSENGKVETTPEKFNKYCTYIKTCAFLTCLRSKLSARIQLLRNLEEMKENYEMTTSCENIIVSWVDTFQGLERDLVIFLPGEAAGASSGDRVFPTPGLAEDMSPADQTTDMSEPPPTAAAKCPEGLSRFYWRTSDVRRYTDWDKKSLVYAATRCTAQLVLLVP